MAAVLIPFEHRMAAHCETGTLGAQLAHAGLELTEPMLLGVGAGVFFVYLETKKMPFPLVATRTEPGKVREKVAKRLGIGLDVARFRDPQEGRAALDELLDRGQAVAAQVDMFYMDYFPRHMRAHFNGHYLSVIGKNGDRYTVSDCYYPGPAEIHATALARGRFAAGTLAPKGLLYHPTDLPEEIDLKTAVVDGIKEACRNMLKLPIPFLGIRGIRKFAKRIVVWPELEPDPERLSHRVMMYTVLMEEQGTGGAGFRYMYATFLQQAAELLQSDELGAMAQKMMANGDRWRDLSLFCARIGKKRDLGPERFSEAQKLILDRADEEEALFKDLARIAGKLNG